MELGDFSIITDELASEISSGTFVSKDMMFLAYFAAIIIAVFASAALLYHWKQYGLGDEKVRRGRALYLAGVIAILITTGALLLFTRP